MGAANTALLLLRRQPIEHAALIGIHPTPSRQQSSFRESAIRFKA
jgi:hypothetical protein